MTSASDNVEQVFWNALQLGSEGERSAYLDKACAGDTEFRRLVEKLLLAQPKAAAFLEQPFAEPQATTDEPVREGHGTVIGPYKLLQQIGEGGMGTVFMAEQTEPVQRKVALKLIKPGMDSRQVIARFEAERQALAMMDHVNIARVFDGGATENGRPYFVMELVHGLPITKYCDDNHLTPRERLELFVPVCQAIQHAHQKGIIHRDVKPSNVMVTLYDGKPVPKVIDFGVAKATEQKLTERTLFTQYGTMVGTLEYVSPEQAEMSALGVDTRSDIYSLGVLLYELLTGSTPLTHQRMKEAAYGEILRMIKEEEPPKPSTRLSDSGEALASISANRHTEPAKLTKLVRGELDWIVMKTLEKDRNRRYETANGLAADVQRYLDDETVLACPPSAWYRSRKFARRNKKVLLTAAMISCALVVGAGVSTWQAILAVKAETRAKARFEQARRAADEMYTQVAEKWLANEPHLEKVQREFLLKALAFYEEFARDESADPTLRLEAGKALSRVGAIQQRLGQYDKAKTAYSQAITLLQQQSTEAPSPEFRQELARCQDHQGRLSKEIGQPESARAAHDAAQVLWERLVAEFPADAHIRQGLTDNVHHRVVLLMAIGQPEEALRVTRQSLPLLETLVAEFPGEPDYRHRLAMSTVNRASLLSDFGQMEEAEKVIRTAQALEQELTVAFPRQCDYRYGLMSCCNNLATLLWTTNRFQEADKTWREALANAERLAADFPAVPRHQDHLAMTLNNLGVLLETLGRSQEAGELRTRALDVQKRLVASFPTNPEYRVLLAMCHVNLGELLKTMGQYQEAEKAHRQALAIRQELAISLPMVPDHQDALADSHHNLGHLLVMLRNLPEAEKAYRQALAIRRKLAAGVPSLLDYQEQLAVSCSSLGIVLRDGGHAEQAEPLYREALTIHEKLAADFSSQPRYQHQLGASLHNLSTLFSDRNELAEARLILERAIRHQQAALRGNNRNPTYRTYLRNHHENLATTLTLLGESHDAEKYHLLAVKLGAEIAGQFPDVPEHRKHLALSYHRLGQLLRVDARRQQEAEDAFRHALELRARLVADAPASADSRSDLANTLNYLGVLLYGLRREQEAEDTYRRALLLREALVDASPESADNQSELGGLLQNLAMPLRNRGQLADARALLERAIGHQQVAIRIRPDQPSYRRYLGSHYHVLAATLLRLGDHAGAAKAATQMLDDSSSHGRRLGEAVDFLADCASLASKDAELSAARRQELTGAYADQAKVLLHSEAESHPDRALAHNSLAWLLANCIAPNVRNPAQAVALARKAVALKPEEAGYWNTLGSAQYRLGDWKGASAALEKSMALGKGGDSSDWFFLAMACWQLGEKEQARKWYDQAVEWMDKNRPKDEELRRFRAEAAELLGIIHTPEEETVRKPEVRK